MARVLLYEGKPETTVGTMIGERIVTLLMPAARKVQNAADRIEQVQRNQYVAFALAAASPLPVGQGFSLFRL
jgi:hypothetical protein